MTTPDQGFARESRYMKIRFINGTERSFAFAPLTEKINAANLLTFVHRAMDSRRLILQLEERLIIIPFDNIQSIEVVPTAGHVLPEAIHILHEFS